MSQCATTCQQAKFCCPQTLDSFDLFLQDYLDAYYGDVPAYYDDYGLPGDLPSRARGPPGGPAGPGTGRSGRPGGSASINTPDADGVQMANGIVRSSNATSNSSAQPCLRRDGRAAFLLGSAAIQAPVPSLEAGSTAVPITKPDSTAGSGTRGQLPPMYATMGFHTAGFGASPNDETSTRNGTLAGLELVQQTGPELPLCNTTSPVTADGAGSGGNGSSSNTTATAANGTAAERPAGPLVLFAR